MRQDFKYENYALEQGFDVRRRESKCHPYVFEKGNNHVWLCKKGWACAQLVDNYFTGHKYYDDLKDALDSVEGKNEA